MKTLLILAFAAVFSETIVYSREGLIEVLKTKDVLITSGEKRTRITVISDYKPPGSFPFNLLFRYSLSKKPSKFIEHFFYSKGMTLEN